MNEPRWVSVTQQAAHAAVPIGAAVLFLTEMFAPAWCLSGVGVLIGGLLAALAVGIHKSTKEES